MKYLIVTLVLVLGSACFAGSVSDGSYDVVYKICQTGTLPPIQGGTPLGNDRCMIPFYLYNIHGQLIYRTSQAGRNWRDAYNKNLNECREQGNIGTCVEQRPYVCLGHPYNGCKTY